MVGLTLSSSEVSKSDSSGSAGEALTSITVQAGKAKIELAVLKLNDTYQVRIRQLIPDLTEVGDSLEQAKALRQEHDDLVSKLGAKQREFAAVLTKTAKANSPDGVLEVSIQSLADAWKDVNKQMEYRRMLLDQSVTFHSSAQQFASKLDQVESQCSDDAPSYDIDTVRRQLQQHQDLKKGVLEASMSTLQEGQLLLERIRKVALCAAVETRHATTSAAYAIERLLQLLQDKWRRLEQLWYRRWIQLRQCFQMAQLDQEASTVQSWLDTVGEAYIGKRDLGDSLDSAYSLQEECLNIESQFLEIPATIKRLVDTAEYLLHSVLASRGECATARERMTKLARRSDDFGKMFSFRRKNVTQAAQFFSLAQVATVKLQEIESQLIKHNMTDRHGYLANAIVDISAVALHCGRSLMARIGENIPAAKGVESALAILEEKCNRLESMCGSRYGKTEKLNEAVVKLLDNIYKYNSWLTQVAEAVVSVNFDSGSNLLSAQDFLDLHQNLVNDIKVNIAKIKVLDRIVEEVSASGVEADAAAAKDAAEKLKALSEQFTKVNQSAERRLRLASDLVTFHKRVQELTVQMDVLELHLKLEKLDPAHVPDTSVAYMDETFKKMNSFWADVEAKGKQFAANCKEPQSDERTDLERTASSIEFLIAHLSDRKSILTDFIERWKQHVGQGKEFLTQWNQFVKDARQTIDWIMKVENEFFPVIAGELGTNINQVKQHQKRIEDLKPTISKAKNEVEKHLKTAELLSLKGDTHGQRDSIVNDLLKAHTRFHARIGEYRFLLSMAEKFFGNLDQLDELIKKTEKAYSNEEMPKEVTAAQLALRQHYESKAGLQQFINFATEEADSIVVRVRQQDSEALARDEVRRILELTELKRNAWDKAWQDQKTRLDQNFQACQFYFDLKQLQNLLEELQRQLDLRRGNYGSSLTSAEMITKAFQAFLGLANAVEGRMHDFMTTADRVVRDKHYDSRRIRHEVDETDRRWKTFYNSIKNYENALADSTNFFKSWEECEIWINEAAQFLLGISREAPSCETMEDVDRLIKKIETYRIEGFEQQDGRLNGMERIVTDLYGSVAGPEKLQPLLDKNQDMFTAFVKAVEELAILRNNLNKTEQILAQVGAVVEKKAPRQPRFVQPLQNAEITEGHGCAFECRLECDTANPLIEWLKDGLPMSRGTTVYKDGLCRLTIDITNPGDSATYSVKATTSAGVAESSATLKVKEAQQKVIAPTVSGQLKSTDAPEGTSLTLECFITGTPYPTVTWYKDGVQIVDGPDYTTTLGNNAGAPCTLRIRRLNQADHSGVYTVKAVNAGGETSSSGTVTVISIRKPEFTEPLKDELIQEGKGVRLECKYIGEPAPQIQWLFNETQILPSALCKITVDVGSTALEMREVFAEDCGTYTAVAKNLGGEARTSCRVGLVETTLTESTAARAGARRPVRPQFVQPLEDLIVQEGNRIRLECVIAGYPDPEISWLHNGSPVNKTKDIDIFCEDGRCTLVIYEVYLEDAGEYVCVGKNEHGSTQTSCRLIVEPLGDVSDASASATGDVPPKFTQLLKDIEGTEGELIRFECRVIGHPTPVIKWFRGRTQINNSLDFQILSERELQALTIPALCKDDAGNYMVKAVNDAGQAKCYATLLVKPASDQHAMKMRLIESCHSVQTSVIEGYSAPVITRSFRDLHARPGEPCTMEVLIEGTPKPKVHWLFNNEVVIASDYQVSSFGDAYSLHIPAVTDKDAGRFTVIAENPAGKAWCSALLVVVDASQLMGDDDSPPETPLGPVIQPVLGAMPLFSSKPANASPKFLEPLKNATVDEGATVTLECRVAGHPDPAVRWYQEGRPLIAGPATDIRKQGDRATLTLYGVTEHDSGQYTCIALNQSGENSSSATLIVNASAVVPEFLENPRSQRVREGQSARFVARVSGRPTAEVTWFREGVPIVNSPDFAISSLGGTHYLDIAEVFFEDAGKYSVQAQNSAGRQQCLFDLSVEPSAKNVTPSPVVAPQFTKPLSNQQANFGQRVVLECAVPASTKPDQVNWYRNELYLELSPEYQSSYRDGICQLVIPSVNAGHVGRYTCMIVLHGVSSSTDMYLEVLPEKQPEPEAYAPQFDDKLRDVHLSEQGHDAVFVCHLTGRPPPNIQWYHEDYLIKPSKKHEIKLTRDGVCSLRVKTVTPDDVGQYTCVATNLAGHQTSAAALTVDESGVDESSYVSQQTLRRLASSPGRLRDGDHGGVSEHFSKPVFRKVPADLEVTEGQLARFDCIVAGRPRPDVFWFRDGTEVHEDRLHKIVINEEGISSLIIDVCSVHDAGLYTCIARNRAGEDRFQVRLNVAPRPTSSPPRFLSRLTHQTVAVGQPVTFEAEVSGVPVPMLSWQKDNSHIVGSNHYQIFTEGCRTTLHIASVRLEDDAWYQCTAASVSGTATNRVRLTVQAAPRPPSASITERAHVNLAVSATPPPQRASPRQQIDVQTRVVETTSVRTQSSSPAVAYVDASGIAAPRLLEPMRDQHLNDGAMAHFWCKIHSSVPPTCEWYHDSHLLHLSEKHRIANNPRDGDYALMVFDVRPRDAGVYRCVVGNPGGEVTCIAHLHVESIHGSSIVSASPSVHTAESSSHVVASETTVTQSRSQQQQSRAPVQQATVGDPPRFIQPLKDVTTTDGSEVTLTCLLVGRPAPVVSWFHNGGCIDQSTDFAISYDEQAGRTELIIVDCMVDDRGQFSCVATNQAGRAETACTLNVIEPHDAHLIDVDMSEEFRNAAAQLQQQAAPPAAVLDAGGQPDGQAPKFIEPIQPCVVVEGDTCTFAALVSSDPAPEIVWLKEKQDLALTDRHAVTADPVTGRCAMTIRLCSAADTGVYSCRASNTSGRATCTANVVVVPPNVEVTVTEKTTSIKKEKVTTVGDHETRVVENSPTFIDTLQPVTEVYEGSNVRLQCRFTAEPEAAVTWRFNGVEISSNQHLSLTADAGQSTLTIDQVTLGDTGEYICSATNSLGEAATKTFLRVRKTDGDIVPPFPSVHTTQSASDILPEVLKQPIPSGSAFDVAKLLTPVPLMDPCSIIAKDPLSQQPPRFIQTLHNQVVGAGEKALFVVQVDGNPKPSIRWFINGSRVRSADGVTEIVEDLEKGISTLTVKNSSPSSEGEYMCQAENILGTAFTTSHLFIIARLVEGRRSGDSTQMMISACTRPKPTHVSVATEAAYTSTTNLFSAMIRAEKPSLIDMRTDGSHRIPVTNILLPISIAEKHCGIDVSAPSGHGVIELDLKKHKLSTLNVEQKSMPMCYRMIAEIQQPLIQQTFSETIAIDAGDRRPFEIALLKKKTSVMDVERKALPRGLRMEAEVLPPPSKTTLVYIARSKCIGAMQAHREECFIDLRDGRQSPPTFIEKLQPLAQAIDGAKVTLACRVVGRPMPKTVGWLRDGRPIKPDNPDFGCTYDPKTGRATLSINEVFPEDAGLFECVAKNECGKAATQAELLVEAYEYVADSEESCATESICSWSLASALEALPMMPEEYARTVAEALLEETRSVERGYEDTIQTADVMWCVPDLIVPQPIELISEFRLNRPQATDGFEIANECRGAELARPLVAGKTQAMVATQQTTGFGEEQLSAVAFEAVNSAMQEIVEKLSSDRATKQAGKNTFARPEPIPDVFGGEPLLEKLDASEEDRAAEKLTSPLESSPARSHPACWTFPQVATFDADQTGSDVERAPSPDEIIDTGLVEVDLNRSSTGVLFSRVGLVVEYHSEGEDEDLFLETSEESHSTDVCNNDGLRQVSIQHGRCALAATLSAYTEPETADKLAEEPIPVEEPKTESYNTLLFSASKISPVMTQAVTQFGDVKALIIDGPFVDASKPEMGHETVVATTDMEPARNGRARPVLALTSVELVAIDRTAEFEGKLISEKPFEGEVANELCVASCQAARPVTKVRAIVELVPHEVTPLVERQVGCDVIPEFGNESVVSAELERAKSAVSGITRTRLQTAVIGTERTVELDAEAEAQKMAESTVDAEKLSTKSSISGYPVAHTLGSIARASPETVIDCDFDELSVPQIGQEVVVEAHAEKAILSTGRPTQVVQQLRQLSVDSIEDMKLDIEHEKSLEEEVAAACLQASNKQSNIVTKVIGVVELVAREKTPVREDELVGELSVPAMIATELTRVSADLNPLTKVKEFTELTGSERIDEFFGADAENLLELSNPTVVAADLNQVCTELIQTTKVKEFTELTGSEQITDFIKAGAENLLELSNPTVVSADLNQVCTELVQPTKVKEFTELNGSEQISEYIEADAENLLELSNPVAADLNQVCTELIQPTKVKEFTELTGSEQITDFIKAGAENLLELSNPTVVSADLNQVCTELVQPTKVKEFTELTGSEQIAEYIEADAENLLELSNPTVVAADLNQVCTELIQTTKVKEFTELTGSEQITDFIKAGAENLLELSNPTVVSADLNQVCTELIQTTKVKEFTELTGSEQIAEYIELDAENLLELSNPTVVAADLNQVCTELIQTTKVKEFTELTGSEQIAEYIELDAENLLELSNPTVVAADLNQVCTELIQPTKVKEFTELTGSEQITDFIKAGAENLLELSNPTVVAADLNQVCTELIQTTKVKEFTELTGSEQIAEYIELDAENLLELSNPTVVAADLNQVCTELIQPTKVKEFTELTGSEQITDFIKAGAENLLELSNPTVVAADLNQVCTELIQTTKIKEFTELTGSERIAEFIVEDEVENSVASIIFAEVELIQPSVNEVDIKEELPIIEEFIDPVRRAPEREAPVVFPTFLEHSPVEDKIIASGESVTDLFTEEPVVPNEEVVEACLLNADVFEPVIYLEETTIEETVIHVRKIVQFEAVGEEIIESSESVADLFRQFESVGEEIIESGENDAELFTEEPVVPVVPNEEVVEACLLNADVFEPVIYLEETTIEETVIHVRKIVQFEAVGEKIIESSESVADLFRQFEAVGEEIIESGESVADLYTEEPVVPNEEVVEACLLNADVFEPVIYLEETTIEEIVIHVKKAAQFETVSLPQTVVHHVEARVRSPSPSFEETICEEKTEVTRSEYVARSESDVPPSFVVPLYNTKATDGSSVTLECQVNGHPPPAITWSVDGTEIKPSSDFRVSEEESTGKCSLVIDEVLPEDEGQYCATAVNRAGRCSTTAYLTIFRESPEREYLSSGEELYSSGEETMTTWTVENKQIFEEFRNVEIDILLHRKGTSTAEAVEQQVVEYQPPQLPVFVRQLESMDAFEGSSVKLECDVKGFPLPEISWFQDGKKISPDDEHMKLDYSDGRCILSIDRVCIDDEAEYICEARNAYGTASTWAELLVEKLIEGLEKLVVEEFFEVEIEMNFKWKDKSGKRAKTPPKMQATIM